MAELGVIELVAMSSSPSVASRPTSAVGAVMTPDQTRPGALHAAYEA
jgi:hypothetical protein